MAVAAVLLATVVASSLSGGDPAGDPRASFTFDAENDTVLVRHFGGDTIDGAELAVESGDRGRLGTFDGSDGVACTANVTRVSRGSVCRVPDAAYERLYVVWEGPDNRSLILARRAPDPTPTPSPTPLTPETSEPEPTPTTSVGGTVSATPTATSPTRTPTPTPTATAVPTPTGTPTAEPNTFPTPTPTLVPDTGNATASGGDG